MSSPTVGDSQVIRVPNLPIGKMVGENGEATDDEMLFRQTLVSSLQRLFGSEGCVLPTQSYANMLVIQNKQLPSGAYSCAFGTGLYVPDFPVLAVPTPSIVFSVNSGGGVPLFKRVTLI